MTQARGRTAARVFKALHVAQGNPTAAAAYCDAQNWLDTRQVAATLKAAVTAYGTDDMGLPTPAAVDFAEMVRPLTIMGKLQDLRRVPARVRAIAATAGSTAYWSGERAPRPISKLTLAGETLEPLGVVAMLVTTTELLRSGSPDAETTLSRDLAAAAAAALDSAFIDHTNAGTAGVKPASITNGVTPYYSTGAGLTSIDSDLGVLVNALSDAGSDLQSAQWVIAPRTACYLARLRYPTGVLAYPNIGMKGGELMGLPVIVSAHVPVDASSPGFGNTSITLVDASQVTVADEGGGKFELGKSATIEMTDSPSGGTTSLVSMFQSDSAALKVTRYANWRRCRDGMAQVMLGVGY